MFTRRILALTAAILTAATITASTADAASTATTASHSWGLPATYSWALQSTAAPQNHLFAPVLGPPARFTRRTSQPSQIRQMIPMHSYLTSQLAASHQADLRAEARRQHLARQARATCQAPLRTGPARRAIRLLRPATRPSAPMTA